MMRSEYLYVIVDSKGSSWKIVEGRTEKAVLPQLLAEGWRPVRETPYPAQPGESYILICLEREPEGQMGFGFGH